ncbi:MAG: HAD family hydrolase [Candidatus Borkfalkiaceae bacterium]|nr:HAD family hydrolase [Clostridia bacterium]MDY6222661.1 HAD family hydrolase [Christensenellaceae bacterium]
MNFTDSTLFKNKPSFGHVIFDADDTLLCYRDDERGAFLRLFSTLGVAADDALLSFSCNASERIWAETGLYDVSSPRVQKHYHALYRDHITHVFDEIFAYLHSRKIAFTPVSSACARDLFLTELETGGHYVEGARETLAVLKSRGYVLSVATNGLETVQRGRTKGLLPFFDHLFVSESLGAIKPAEEFFIRMLRKLNARKEECLFVGDSLSSDIAGAKTAGICCCYFSPCGEKPPAAVPVPDFTVRRLTELLAVL